MIVAPFLKLVRFSMILTYKGQVPSTSDITVLLDPLLLITKSDIRKLGGYKRSKVLVPSVPRMKWQD